MKRLTIIALATLFVTVSAKGQNLFFIGEQSYTSTPTFKLQSNTGFANDLNIVFAKDRNTALIAVSRHSPEGSEIRGKLIVYLDDGTVLTLKEENTDYVDNTSKAVYHFSENELNLLMTSNINTVRYWLERKSPSLQNSGNYTASNKGNTKIDFPALVTDFFEKNKAISSDSKNDYMLQKGKSPETDTIRVPAKSVETKKSTAFELQWEGDQDRAPVVQPLPENTSDVEATLTIRFEVKPDGTIGRIIPLRKMNPELEREVIRLMRKWRFSRLPSGAPQQSQWGTITFRFESDEF